jgi:hypothetical protein
MDNSEESNKNFFKHVFNFDDESKAEILNIIQYALLAIIPVIILNKLMSKYVPESNENKGSLEITAEIIVQIIVMFMGLLLIHRIITFIPTYSREKYPDFHIVYVILAILMITMSLQTKLGDKVSILVERITELWEGAPKKKKKKQSGAVKVSQPISGQITGQQMNNEAINQAIYTDGTAISSLPTNDVMYGNESSTAQSQSLPNYNSAQVNQEGFHQGPVAASEFLGGGGGFGSAW